MTTHIALLAGRCGLSVREGAEFTGVRLDTFKSWSAGRNQAPAGAVEELRTLYRKIEQAAAAAVDQIRSSVPAGSVVELGYCADDYEAQQLGFPFATCHNAMLGLVVARLDHAQVKLVPRGSTVATAAAMEAHGQ